MATLPGLVAFIVLMWVLARRKPARWPVKPALLPASVETSTGAAASFTVIVSPGASPGSAAGDASASLQETPVVQLEGPGTTQTQSKAWLEKTAAESQRREREASLKNPWLVLHLSQWLKQKLVQKLLVDRAQLMQSQQAATLKMLKVDERLARIELQIQQHNRAYERRIEELTQELLAAKEENREMIRARIAQVKAEMEAARTRMLAQAEDDGSG